MAPQESTNKLRDLANDIETRPPRVSVPPRSVPSTVYRMYSQIPDEHKIFAVLILAMLAGAYMLRGTWT